MNTEYFVKLIIGAIYSDSLLLENAKAKMQKLKLKIQFQSAELPFELTEYYNKEMGNNLKRRFLSIEGLQKLENFFEWKLKMVKIENHLRQNNKRRINLDPGYIDSNRVVLLSGKEGSQKIYLNNGVWADLILLREKGRYKELPWTFPDLREGRYEQFFLHVQKQFKEDKKLHNKINHDNIG